MSIRIANGTGSIVKPEASPTSRAPRMKAQAVLTYQGEHYPTSVSTPDTQRGVGILGALTNKGVAMVAFAGVVFGAGVPNSALALRRAERRRLDRAEDRLRMIRAAPGDAFRTSRTLNRFGEG